VKNKKAAANEPIATTSQPEPARPKPLGRREFLRYGLAGAAAGLSLGSWESALARVGQEAPQVVRYPTLGRTGLKISDIGFGSGAPVTADVVRHAYDRGINYFDSAENYPLGDSGVAEQTLAEALKGKRDKVFITSKTKAVVGDSKAALMTRLEESLKRLDTDYVDVYFNHAVNDPARIENPEWLQFIDDAKKQGKIRFSGMSGHGGNLAESLRVALDQDLVDVILVAYNFGQDPSFLEQLTKNFDRIAKQPALPELLAKAKQKGVGVIAMKTLMGARLNDMRRFESQGNTFAQAAFRWTLSNPNVDALIVSMKSADQVDEYLGASGALRTSSQDRRLLQHYMLANSSTSCRPGCNACESSCPSSVEIADVLRSRMYSRDYNDPRRGKVTYDALAVSAMACTACSAQPCMAACPSGVEIATLTREHARRMA
jgi:predicted aldo/keto reductase-like oxidoreductase